MIDHQEGERLLEMERALHQHVWGPWSADHAGRPQSEITQLEYNRDLYPEQRLDTYRSRMNVLPTYLLPGRLFSVIIEKKLAKSFDSSGTARQMIRSFQERRTSTSDDTPLVEKIKQLIAEGETLSLVDSHTEFTGGVRLLAALSAAMRKSKYIRLNNTIVSKTMTREIIRGKQITQHVSPVSHIVWVNPDTDSYDNLIEEQGLDELAAELIMNGTKKVNAGAMRELKLARESGGILQWAPFSSAVERINDPDGRLLKLKAPRLPDQAPGLLGRSRYTLPVAYWPDRDSGEVRWTIGELHDRDMIDVKDRRVRDGIYIERVVGELCTMLYELSGVPVEHDGKTFPEASHQIDATHAGTL